MAMADLARVGCIALLVMLRHLDGVDWAGLSRWWIYDRNITWIIVDIGNFSVGILRATHHDEDTISCLLSYARTQDNQ